MRAALATTKLDSSSSFGAKRPALKGPGYDDEAPLGLSITSTRRVYLTVTLTEGKAPAKPLLAADPNRGQQALRAGIFHSGSR